MAGNVNNIVGVSKGAGTGTSLIYFAPYGTAAPVGVAGTAGVQTITVTGTPTGGTLTLLWNGYSTSVPYNATNTAVQTALRALPGGGGFTVTGGPGPATPWVATSPAAMVQAIISTPNANLTLTGGTTPNASVTQTTPGIQSTNPGTATLVGSYVDPGLVDVAGLGFKYGDTTKEIDSFGLSSAALVLFSKTSVTFTIAFQETNHTSLEIFHRLPLGSTGVADAGGYIGGVTDGAPTVQSYAAMFYALGANGTRVAGYLPNVQNTSKGDVNISYGDIIDRPVTFTAFPDASNNAVYWYPIIPSMAGL